MPFFKAVLFDWVGTLIVPKWGPAEGRPRGASWIERSMRQLGRDASELQVRRISLALSTASERPDVQQGWFRADASPESHRQGYNRWVNAAGIDSALAQEMYAALSDPTDARFAVDAEPTLRTLKAAGLKLAVVSDIHFDLRPGFVKNGLGGYIDHFVLSFEHGICKPDPAMFRLALDALGVQSCEALMVGDRSGYDGAAVEAGVATLLVPPLTQVSQARLHLVSAACGISSP
ncbi:HAD family hydrolase [Actinacidiphila rubida]|uniref:Haloacid dehalogenase superfamily, subfamily IA, variant 3 with third motif having DD or ED/haloacid dehalogenase superfamily, subfamily IA, variant 1 with third motif having Dx(3-4)D or Dx(3-4)E n=1 Tax=Actinacidiphila rubida TaxID=310780 RepID=A0A1H8KHP4_9ACTN|nr:HAD family hydrolase [Actinacidiphila rubida]SEN92490.1 haloacid dehalogenase superfamily, subfamily IA, variant 3 with third motif having DD or ED/haloacid dehalogenase superfamily, subfamily IA, variant 1 with third motif having Dx(3-4)D or Dx(3-4)E [Actinacidiphila rubida]